jgi:dephospho-CoA kinase
VKTLGLTGSIATGKSTALSAFAALSVPVFSSDEAVHALYQGEAVPVVETLFPGVSHNGTIDRAALVRRMVEHPERLKELESVVHPLVRKRMAEFLSAAQSTGAALAVVDVPLLFETGFDYGFDAVAVTIVDEAEQRRRALARPGMTEEKLATILARQMPQAEKAKRADFVIDTSGPVEETAARVREIAAALSSSPVRSTGEGDRR